LTSHDPVYVTDVHRMLRDQARRFVEEEIRPHGDAWEKAGSVPRDVYRRMGGLGFFGLRYPEKYGGSALDAVASAVLWEEMGKGGYAGVSVGAAVHAEMASPHLARFGSEAQKDRLMPKIVSGEIITAVAVTEPDGGSDVAAL